MQTKNSTSSPTNLTTVAAYSRKSIKIGAILAVFFLFSKFIFVGLKTIYLVINPPPPPPPTVGFGKIPAISFPSQEDVVKPNIYRLELATGSFPKFEDKEKVYLMKTSARSILNEDRAKKIAESFGFSGSGDNINDEYVRWTKNDMLSSTLEVDLVTLNSKYRTDFLSKAELLSNSNLPNLDQAKRALKMYVGKAYSLEDEILKGPINTKYLKAIGDRLVEAASFSDAEFIEVNINRENIAGKYKIVTAKGNQGIIRGIVKGGLSYTDNIVEFDFFYQGIFYDQDHSYPLRSVDSAWEVLKSGEGYIAQNDGLDQVTVRHVSLGYYDSIQREQQYMQPVFIFEGDDDFMGLVSAVDPIWIDKE